MHKLAKASVQVEFGKSKSTHQSKSFIKHLLLCLTVSLSVAAFAQAGRGAATGSVIVHSKFGGQIFGFDVDQNGTEGVLTEAGGSVNAAVETFDQKTGKILKVVTKTTSQDDFIGLGVFGNSVGLIEREHVISLFHVKRTFHVLNPLSSNKFTGSWTPPLGTTHLITSIDGSISRIQGSPKIVAWAADNSGQFIPWVFESNIDKNTFGPIVKITDSTNFGSVVSPVAFDSRTNQALIGGGTGAFGTNPTIGVVDLTKGAFTEFTGIGLGFVNGIAVDSADGIFCTATEDDASVEFYNLKTKTGFVVVLPGSNGQQFLSGWDVEFDPVHKLFLISQPNSSTGTGSSVYVYDTKGNLKNTINGLAFGSPMRIALHPKTRTAYVNGPIGNEIQSVAY